MSLILLLSGSAPVATRMYVSYAKVTVPAPLIEGSIAESLTLTDQAKASIRTAVSESLSLTDATDGTLPSGTRMYVSYAKVTIPEPSPDRAVAESISLADATDASVVSSATRMYVSYALVRIPSPDADRGIAESIDLSDVVASRATYQAAISETISLVDAPAGDIPSAFVVTWLQLYQEDQAAAVAESLTLADALKGAAGAKAAESITLVDAPAGNVIGADSRAVIESLTLADIPAGKGIFKGAVAEAITLTDAPVAKGTYVRAAAETLSLADVPVAHGEGVVWEADIAESISLTDSPTIPIEPVFGEPTARLWAGAINWRLGSQRAGGSARLGSRLASQRSMRFGSRVVP